MNTNGAVEHHLVVDSLRRPRRAQQTANRGGTQGCAAKPTLRGARPGRGDARAPLCDATPTLTARDHDAPPRACRRDRCRITMAQPARGPMLASGAAKSTPRDGRRLRAELTLRPAPSGRPRSQLVARVRSPSPVSANPRPRSQTPRPRLQAADAPLGPGVRGGAASCWPERRRPPLSPRRVLPCPRMTMAQPARGPMLVFTDAKGVTRQIPLGHQAVTLGRSRDDVVPFQRNESVSRFHAEVVTMGAGWLVLDRDSNGGTYVNGVEKRPWLVPDASVGRRTALVGCRRAVPAPGDARHDESDRRLRRPARPPLRTVDPPIERRV